MKDVFVGTTAEGERVYVSVELRRIDKPRVTIDHDEIEGFTELSISGVMLRKGGRLAVDSHWISAGQNLDELLRVIKPARGWTLEEVRRIHELWSRWHLNGTKAGCRHQSVVWEKSRYGVRQPSLAETRPCAITGYRYGSAWLVEPMPEDVLDEIRGIIARKEVVKL